MKKNPNSIKAIAVFILTFSLLTFFSKTIYNSTLPKVETQSVSSGTLVTTISGSDFIIEADHIERVGIDNDLTLYQLCVERIVSNLYDYVYVGDVLIQFDSVVAEHAFQKVERLVEGAQTALSVWDENFSNAWKELSLDILTLEAKITTSETDVDELLIQLEKLRSEQLRMEQSRIIGGEARREKELLLAQLQDLLETFLELKNNDWSIHANCEGLIIDININAGENYSGLLPLLRIIPSTAMIQVGIETNVKDDHISTLGAGQILVYSGLNMPQTSDTGWSYLKKTANGLKQIWWAVPKDGIENFSQWRKLNFRMESSYYRTLVPNNAIIGQKYIFVLDSRIGLLGKEELFARKVLIQDEIVSDDNYTFVPSGVAGVDKVIVKWDRPIMDGDTVLLPLE